MHTIALSSGAIILHFFLEPQKLYVQRSWKSLWKCRLFAVRETDLFAPQEFFGVCQTPSLPHLSGVMAHSIPFSLPQEKQVYWPTPPLSISCRVKLPAATAGQRVVTAEAKLL